MKADQPPSRTVKESLHALRALTECPCSTARRERDEHSSVCLRAYADDVETLAAALEVVTQSQGERDFVVLAQRVISSHSWTDNSVRRGSRLCIDPEQLICHADGESWPCPAYRLAVGIRRALFASTGEGASC